MVHLSCISVATTQAKICSHPVHYAWDRVDESVKGHCFNVDDFFIGSGSANVLLNFLIFVLVGFKCFSPQRVTILTFWQPIPLLWRLRTTLKQQIVLTTLFTLAGLYVSAQGSLFDW